MRELKFRVWSNFWKRYAFDAELYADGSLYAMFDDDNGVPHHENTDLVVELNTSLKDKNGKDIYEGDIVKNIRANYEVKFGVMQDTDCSYLYQGWAIDDWSLYEEHDSVEVIGNIHENPNLI